MPYAHSGVPDRDAPSRKLDLLRCVYCGGPAGTRDHVPSRNLYKGFHTLIRKVVVVPACDACNKSFTKDEEWFRNVLCTARYGNSLTATALMDGPVARSIRYGPDLGIATWRKMAVNDVYLAGVYLGRKTVLKLDTTDHARLRRVLTKYTRGLFWHHHSVAVPQDWSVEHNQITWESRYAAQRVAGAMSQRNVLVDGVFTYAWNSVPETHQSVFIYEFFGMPMFYTFVVDPALVARVRARSGLTQEPGTSIGVSVSGD